MREGWSEITNDKARELATRHALKPVPWTTLDETYFFEEYEWADEAQTRYAFPGTTHVLVANWYYFPDDVKWRVKDAWLESVS